MSDNVEDLKTTIQLLKVNQDTLEDMFLGAHTMALLFCRSAGSITVSKDDTVEMEKLCRAGKVRFKIVPIGTDNPEEATEYTFSVESDE